MSGPAIQALDHRCWVLTKGGVATTEGEEEPHYPSRDKAIEALATRNSWLPRRERLDLVPVQLDHECLVLTTVCGYTLDEDGDGICHSEDRDSLFTWAMGYGYAVLTDGAMLCGPERCVVCTAVERDETPPAPPLPIVGQLDIAGGEVSPADVINLGDRRRLQP